MLQAADPASPDSAIAMGQLCESYWYPAYAFIRRRGYSAHQSEDLTQEFFARLLSKNFLAGVGPEKGKFRSFLLVCLTRFLANEWDRQSAQKRGGGRRPIPLDVEDAERRYSLEPSHNVTAERLFERRWAMTLLEKVLTKLQSDFTTAGKAELFNHLKPYLILDDDAPSYAQTAERLGMTPGALKVAVHRLRQRYALLLRAEVARTTSGSEDVDSEIRDLLAAVKA